MADRTVTGPRVLAVTTAVIVVSVVADAVGWPRVAVVVSPALVVAAMVAARIAVRRRRAGEVLAAEMAALRGAVSPWDGVES